MRQRLFGTLPLLLFGLLFARSSAAQDSEASREASPAEVEQCVAQHDSARQLRLNESWLNARAAMQDCADERCPMAIAADCRAWLEELARVLPTLLIVVEREDDAQRGAPLRALLDGAPLEIPDPPAPIELLPGRHQLRVELGGSFVERELMVQSSEKNHIEHIRFAAKARPVAAPQPQFHRPIPVLTYALSAGAVVAFAGAGVLLESALQKRQEAELNCAPYCPTSVRDSIRARLVLADIAAGAGLLLTGLGLYTFVRRPVVASQARSGGPALVATPSGAAFFWQGQF
jgi:hypothetical protein